MESVDALFNKAIDTIQLLSNNKHYLPRPPIKNRIKLYGLYKQATQGDFQDQLSDTDDDSSSLSGMERLKIESWESNRGLDKQSAKIQYVNCLLSTMKLYANDENFKDSKLLFDELEYLWDQFRENNDSSSDSATQHTTSFKTVNDRYEMIKWQNNVNLKLNQLNKRLNKVVEKLEGATPGNNNKSSSPSYRRWILEIAVLYLIWKNAKYITKYYFGLKVYLKRVFLLLKANHFI